MGKVILINNQKGGVGKTTTAVNLAVGLSYALRNQSPQKPGRVLVVDTDPQGCVSTALDIDPGEKCLSQILLEESEYSNVIVKVDDLSRPEVPDRPNLWVLPATLRLSSVLDQMNQDYGALTEMAGRVSSGARKHMGIGEVPTISDTFERVMGPLRQAFAYIVIDSAPTVGALSEALFRFADDVIVPTEMDFHSVTQTLKHTHYIEQWQAAGAKSKLFCVVPTMYEANLNLTRDMEVDLRQYYANIARPIPKRTAIGAAPSYGLTILEYDPKSDGAKAYGSLVTKVLRGS